MTTGSALRILLSRQGPLLVPGAHDAITARLAAEAGFEALYLSGSAMSTAVAGIPDIDLFTVTEISRVTQYVSQAVSLPLIVDADTGHGNALGVMRTVRELERSGAAAIQLEDQISPKRCGHLDGKRLVSLEEMAGKVRAAVAARRDPDLVMIARTDAREIEGMDRALERAKRYRDAGADVIFPEALHTEEEFRAFARPIDLPLLANMTEFGKTPYYTAEDFHKWGYKIVLFPVSPLRVAMKSIRDFLVDLKKTGTQREWTSRMMSRKEIYTVIEYPAYEALEAKFSPSPDGGER